MPGGIKKERRQGTSGHGLVWAWLMVGLDDLKGLFQPEQFYDSILLKAALYVPKYLVFQVSSVTSFSSKASSEGTRYVFR